MKANELMIGDWGNIYVFPNENPKGKDLFPAKITAILTPTASESSGDTIECMFTALDGTGGVGYASRPPETFLPIPLTTEILEKNGWKDWCEHSTIARSVSVLVDDNTNLCIQEIKGQNSMFVQISHCGAGTFEFRKHLKYIHELQHALRLFGIDKEIIL